jgi:hypothetical protein
LHLHITPHHNFLVGNSGNILPAAQKTPTKIHVRELFPAGRLLA